jgi:hypothetical protein
VFWVSFFFVAEDFNCVVGFILCCRRFQLCFGFHFFLLQKISIVLWVSFFVLQKISIVLWVSFCVADFNCVVGFSFVLQISIVL